MRFPAGTYLSYSIELKSNITLFLDQGSTILAADPPSQAGQPGYDLAEPNPWGDRPYSYQDYGHSHWHNSLIWGENLENISIVGPGRIYGRGPVSYTHLDVYKRQSLHRTLSSRPWPTRSSPCTRQTLRLPPPQASRPRLPRRPR